MSKNKLEKKGEKQIAKGVTYSLEALVAVEDYRWVRDPFVGFEWEIGRIGLPGYQKHLKEQQKASPIYAAMAKAAILDSYTKGRRKKKKGARETENDLILKALESLDLADMDITSVTGKDGAAEHLVRNIRSDTQSVVEYGMVQLTCEACGEEWTNTDLEACPKCGGVEWSDGIVALDYETSAGVQMLTNTSPAREDMIAELFPEDQEDEESKALAVQGGSELESRDAGTALKEMRQMTLGDALHAWVLREAMDSEKFLQKFKGRAGKNLKGSSAGA